MTSALLAMASVGPCPSPPFDERQLMSAYAQGVRYENDDEATGWAEAYAREGKLDELRFLLEHGCRAPHACAWKDAAPRCLKYLIQYHAGLHGRGDGRPIDGWVTSRRELHSTYANAASLAEGALPEIPFFSVVSGWIEIASGTGIVNVYRFYTSASFCFTKNVIESLCATRRT